MAAWSRAVRAVLLDINGVLYDSGGDGGGTPIAGSAEAVRRWDFLQRTDPPADMESFSAAVNDCSAPK